MKALLSFTFFALVLVAGAQVTLSAVAGVNTTGVHAGASTIANANYAANRPGYQAGLQVQRDYKNWQLYIGLMFEKQYFQRSISPANINWDYPYYSYYKPALLTMPLVAGYKLQLTKKLGLRLYGGLYGTMGVGGKYYAQAYCDPMACPELHGDIYYNNYSGDIAPQMARFSWGSRFGFGIANLRNLQLECLYTMGLSNFLTPDIVVAKYREQMLSVNVKVPIMK